MIKYRQIDEKEGGRGTLPPQSSVKGGDQPQRGRLCGFSFDVKSTPLAVEPHASLKPNDAELGSCWRSKRSYPLWLFVAMLRLL